MQKLKYATIAAFIIFLSGCSPAEQSVVTEDVAAEDVAAIQEAAHGRYVEAINRNDVDGMMEVLTDDVVYQGAGAPEIVGRPAVREFIAAYLDDYSTQWEKTPIGFTVNGDWAFERYTYRSTDTNRETGEVTTDVGKGVIVFRRGDDNNWRVAIDGWSSDQQ
jgi:ketosteroid isomerase-like protein